MTRYLVVIEKAKRNYSAYCPDLPGCVATGSTRRAVEKNIRSAVRLHLEGLRAECQPVPAQAAIAEYVSA